MIASLTEEDGARERKRNEAWEYANQGSRIQGIGAWSLPNAWKEWMKQHHPSSIDVLMERDTAEGRALLDILTPTERYNDGAAQFRAKIDQEKMIPNWGFDSKVSDRSFLLECLDHKFDSNEFR